MLKKYLLNLMYRLFFVVALIFGFSSVYVSSSASQPSPSRILVVQQPRALDTTVYLILGYDAAPYKMHYVEHLAWLQLYLLRFNPRPRVSTAE